MPESRLARTREAYEEPELPETRCIICGAALNEPHAPECYRHPHNAEVAEHGYGMGI